MNALTSTIVTINTVVLCGPSSDFSAARVYSKKKKGETETMDTTQHPTLVCDSVLLNETLDWLGSFTPPNACCCRHKSAVTTAISVAASYCSHHCHLCTPTPADRDLQTFKDIVSFNSCRPWELFGISITDFSCIQEGIWLINGCRR